VIIDQESLKRLWLLMTQGDVSEEKLGEEIRLKY